MCESAGMHDSGHLRLRPGYLAVRRDDTHLQVGVDPPRRAILPDTADVRRLLSDLSAGRAARPTPSRATLPVLRALDALVDAGLVVDAAAPPPRPTVQVDAPPDLADALGALLGAAHAARQGEVVVVASPRPLRRDRLDPYVQSGLAHLVVEGSPEAWTVGPFVIPGATACLRCIDARLGEDDPRRTLVLDQLARASTPTPQSPLLRSLALSWAARDALTYVAGGRPTTWSATYAFTRTGPADVRRWARHPHCGCAWDLIALGP